MAYLGQAYKHSKDDNFKPFLDSLGIAEEKVQAILNSCPTQKVEKNGDTFTVTTTDVSGTKVLNFQNGVEFDETVTEILSAKTTFTVDGNVITQVQKYPDGKTLTLKRVYSDNELVVELSSSSWNGSAKRFYSAV